MRQATQCIVVLEETTKAWQINWPRILLNPWLNRANIGVFLSACKIHLIDDKWSEILGFCVRLTGKQESYVFSKLLKKS